VAAETLTRARPARRAPRRLPAVKTALIAAAAYIIAIIFLLPYVEMVITALRPQREPAKKTARSASPRRRLPNSTRSTVSAR